MGLLIMVGDSLVSIINAIDKKGRGDCMLRVLTCKLQ